MSFQLVSNIGAKHFYSDNATIYFKLKEYLHEQKIIKGSDLNKLLAFTQNQINILIKERDFKLINKRSTRLKEIEYNNQKILIDISNYVDNQIFNWISLMNLIKKSDSLKVMKSDVPF